MYDDLEPLTDAERELIEKTAKGQDADCRIGNKEADDPAKGAEWGEGRTIRGKIICALLVGDQKNSRLPIAALTFGGQGSQAKSTSISPM
jgi:hypothetical protein